MSKKQKPSDIIADLLDDVPLSCCVECSGDEGIIVSEWDTKRVSSDRGAKVRKAPAVAGKMLGMVATAPDKLAGLRDRALLLVGFGGALRRSELVALDVRDIQEIATGLLVTIRGSKTDQERAGATIAIARGDVACPTKALLGWLDAAGVESGPIFRPIDKGGTVRTTRLTDRSVANIVKAYAERAGFDASTFSGILCEPAS
jgi:integrase